jgi:hypothetical protein
MRRPGTKRTLNTLGLKTSLGRSTRTGSRSSPRVSAYLAIISFLGPRTESILMRLPSARGGACAPPAATSLRLTRMGSCRTRGGRISESIRNRSRGRGQPPAHFHRNPPGRGQLAVFPPLKARKRSGAHDVHLSALRHAEKGDTRLIQGQWQKSAHPINSGRVCVGSFSAHVSHRHP